MKVRLVRSFKGVDGNKRVTWPAGKVFDDAEGPFPLDIMFELKQNSGIAEVIADAGQVIEQGFSDGQLEKALDELEEERSVSRRLREEIAKLAYDLEKSQDTVNSLEVSLQSLRIEASQAKAEFPCLYCDKVFQSERALSTHMTKVHPER